MSTNPKTDPLREDSVVARALSAPARLLILEQLAQAESGGEALAARTGLSVANCSQHLQQLRRAGLAESRRDGKSVIYRLTDVRTLELMALIAAVGERNLARVESLLRGLAEGGQAREPVSREDLAARLAEGTVTVLDVRPAEEFATGHIPGAVNALFDQIERIAAELSLGAAIVAYCRGPYCFYAHQAVAALRRRGLDARRMEGGLPDWRAEDRPVMAAPS